MIEELLAGPTGGRHALDEDAVQTPIFAALTRGGWRRRQQERSAASWDEFRRDPLTAPIPIQTVAPAPSASVTGGAIVDLARAVSSDAVASAALGGVRRSGGSLERTRAAREWSGAATSRRRRAAEPRDWAGLAALAERGRHHLRPVANW